MQSASETNPYQKVTRMANVDQSQMWAQLMQAMQSKLFPNGLGADTVFSAASVARAVNLNATDPGVTNFGVYSLGDIVPSNSPAYNPAPSGFVTSYTQFLDWIDLGGDSNPNLQSQLNIALDGDGGATPGLNAVQAGYNTVYSAAAAQYVLQKQAAATVGDTIAPFKSWVLTNYPQYAAAKNQLDGAQSKVDQLSNQLYGPGYQQVQLARQITGINGGAQDPTTQNAYNMQVTSATYVPPGSTAAVIGAAAAVSTSTTAQGVSRSCHCTLWTRPMRRPMPNGRRRARPARSARLSTSTRTAATTTTRNRAGTRRLRPAGTRSSGRPARRRRRARRR